MLSPLVLFEDLVRQDFGPTDLATVRSTPSTLAEGASVLAQAFERLEVLAKIQRRPLDVVLRWAGEAMVGPLFKELPGLAKGHQSGMTWFVQLDAAMRTALAACDCDAEPPECWVDFIDQQTVRIGFDGPEGLAVLLEGVSRGVAKHFRERVEVTRQSPRAGLDDRRLLDVRMSPERRSAQSVARPMAGRS